MPNPKRLRPHPTPRVPNTQQLKTTNVSPILPYKYLATNHRRLSCSSLLRAPQATTHLTQGTHTSTFTTKPRYTCIDIWNAACPPTLLSTCLLITPGNTDQAATYARKPATGLGGDTTLGCRRFQPVLVLFCFQPIPHLPPLGCADRRLDHDAVDPQRSRQGDCQALCPQAEQQDSSCCSSSPLRCPPSRCQEMDLHRLARSCGARQRPNWQYVLVEAG